MWTGKGQWGWLGNNTHTCCVFGADPEDLQGSGWSLMEWWYLLPSWWTQKLQIWRGINLVQKCWIWDSSGLAKRRHLEQEPGPQEAESSSRYTFLTVFSTSQAYHVQTGFWRFLPNVLLHPQSSPSPCRRQAPCSYISQTPDYSRDFPDL